MTLILIRINQPPVSTVCQEQKKKYKYSGVMGSLVCLSLFAPDRAMAAFIVPHGSLKNARRISKDFLNEEQRPSKTGGLIFF